MLAEIPGYGSFTVTAEAVTMIGVFGGTLHCHLGAGGCRKQGLYFSRTEPRKYLRCILTGNLPDGYVTAWDKDEKIEDDRTEITISVSHELAGKLDGAALDFGTYNKMQRFVWASLPAAKTPSCTCRRSVGAPAGKRSPCLDDQGIGLSNL
ncbi:peptidase [Arthrobacter crystallopoietes]|nr:peptidase [Arthrobacter crystallopoietes]